MATALIPVTIQFLQLPALYLASFTSPYSSLRPLTIIVQVFLCYLHFETLPIYLHNGYWAPFVGSQAVLWIAVTFERLICSRWNYDAGGPERFCDALAKKDGNSRTKSKLYYAIDLCFNARGVDRPWPLKTTPPAYPPSKTVMSFLLGRLASIIISLALILGAAYQPKPPAHLLTPRHVHTLNRINELTIEEVVFKVLSALSFLLGIYTFVCFLCNSLVVLIISTGMYDFRSCRTNFGSIFEAYSIRRFWSHFWHQYLRSTLEGIGDWTVDRLPLLRSNRIVARYSRIFIAFLVSGTVHIGCDVAAKIPLSESGAVNFFCSQALGIMVEDGVQEIYRRSVGSSRKETPKLWAKIMGYVWVVSFMSCTLPVWAFPYLRRHDVGANLIIRPEWIGLV